MRVDNPEGTAKADGREAEPDLSGVEERAPEPQRRGRKTAVDMVRSLGLVLVIVLLLVAITWRARPDPVRVVDYRAATESARLQIDWPVLSPTALTQDWRSTSARVERAADGSIEWYVGMVTPTDRFASVAQSDVERTPAIRKYIADRTFAGVESGEATIAGVTWRRFVTDDEQTRSLVRTDRGVTVVVSGTAEWDELATFAASLRAG